MRQIAPAPAQRQIATKSTRASTQVTAVRSSKSAATAPKPVVAGAKVYIQVGVFDAKGPNGERAARTLAAAGLPAVRASNKAKTLNIIMAGPFADRATATAMLQKVKGAGYTDAYVRR